jgi:predicted transcriptional regulator
MLSAVEKAAEKNLESLISSVFDKKTAKVLITLRDGARKYKELEKILGMSQPALSTFMKELKELGWVATREIPRGGRGRPQKEAKLTRSFKEILAGELEKKRKEIEELKSKLEELEKIVCSVSSSPELSSKNNLVIPSAHFC